MKLAGEKARITKAKPSDSLLKWEGRRENDLLAVPMTALTASSDSDHAAEGCRTFFTAAAKRLFNRLAVFTWIK